MWAESAAPRTGGRPVADALGTVTEHMDSVPSGSGTSTGTNCGGGYVAGCAASTVAAYPRLGSHPVPARLIP